MSSEKPIRNNTVEMVNAAVRKKIECLAAYHIVRTINKNVEK